jgi:Ca-activated chloride channel family protein
MRISQRRFQKLLVALVLPGLCALTIAQEPSTQKESGALVKLSLIVTDTSNHARDDLNKDEIQIRENNVLQNISSLSKDDRTINYAIVFDTTGSFRPLLGSALNAAKSIIENNHAGDQTLLARFSSSDKIETVQEFTSDQKQLIGALDQLYIEAGQSAVIDALYLAVKHTSEYEAPMDRRRAVVLISDGEDRASYYSRDQLVELLRAKDVQVFIIGIVALLNSTGITADAQEKAKELLNRIAHESGGRVFFPKNGRELQQAVNEVVHDLHKQFVLSYQSTNTGTKENFRGINITFRETPGPESLTAITKSGYFINPPDLDRKKKDKKKRSKP